MEHMSLKKIARLAGLLYLGVVITGIFSLMYAPSKLIDWDNATNTYNAIVANQTLFRFWIVCGLACYTFFLFLPLVLYKLLKPVNDDYAKLMVLFALISVPIYFINVQNLFSVLFFVNDSNNVYGFSSDQIHSQVMLFLNQYDNGMRIIHIFSGLWLFPFGYLIFKSGFLPKFLGILLMLGCFGYLIDFIGDTLLKNYSEIGILKFISIPASVGEIGICLWLIIVGVKSERK
ncbi:DUF4386 domain-containing protein [Flavobacterium sp.]|uniref:DUF4386 domain-containing protein n=1 Tax=Flavobacterium sp. TaxID=239 RepID=UPI00261549B6|nr:DUF4386 domain-containing protein [Flavobacterium sp.]